MGEGCQRHHSQSLVRSVMMVVMMKLHRAGFTGLGQSEGLGCHPHQLIPYFITYQIYSVWGVFCFFFFFHVLNPLTESSVSTLCPLWHWKCGCWRQSLVRCSTCCPHRMGWGALCYSLTRSFLSQWWVCKWKLMRCVKFSQMGDLCSTVLLAESLFKTEFKLKPIVWV